MASDESLVEAYQNGSEDALTELFERYTDRVYAFCHRLSGDGTIAEDAVQDVFIKAWRGIGRFDADKSSFKTWIFAIARNAVIDALRKRKDVPFSVLDDSRADSDDDGTGLFAEDIVDDQLLPDMAASQDELRRAVEKALDELGHTDRSIVLMHDIEDMAFEEIGKAVGRPMNTVKSRYRRALARVRDILRQGPHQKGDMPRIP